MSVNAMSSLHALGATYVPTTGNADYAGTNAATAGSSSAQSASFSGVDTVTLKSTTSGTTALEAKYAAATYATAGAGGESAVDVTVKISSNTADGTLAGKIAKDYPGQTAASSRASIGNSNMNYMTSAALLNKAIAAIQNQSSMPVSNTVDATL